MPVIDARSFPAGSDYVWLDSNERPADISVYWPKPSVDEHGWGDGKAPVRRIQFATGSFACARELCSFPDYEKCGPAPYFLHPALLEAGFEVNVERSSITSTAVPGARKRFCEFCGVALDQPHADDCPRCDAPAAPERPLEPA